MKHIKVEFSLDCLFRKDEEARILVGYIPSLRLYSQGRNEDELRNALVSAAEMFIVLCYKKNTLGKVLRDRGMTEATGGSIALAQHNGGEFISISESDRYDQSMTIKVPIELLAAQQVMAECPQH